ncbi:MAG: flagellar hook protein FlgE [Deltaproteobacteria bacterium]|nr:flagellar hook protein FlgE [Deltaproteobacteria bacterium]MBN2673703.1 flagellar hook protein FlgE [Deltaproteobacteria bacterium]
MSIIKTLYTGVSGLQSHGKALGVVGDNIANVNTTGYKAENAVFSDVLGHSLLSTDIPGSGSKVTAITRTFSQGTFVSTDSPTDLAINGNGFFIVNGNLGGWNANFYSRAGQFALDNSGALVNPEGMVLQGYLANGAGEISNQLTDLRIANTILPPEETTEIVISANLDAGATPPTLAWDPTDPGVTSNFSTAITVYDSLGESHRADIYFVKSATANQWDWHALVDGGELTGGTAGVNQELAAGTLDFTTDGYLDTETTTIAPDFDFSGATQNQVITFDFGESLTEGGSGLDGVTQYAASSIIRSQEQDGYGTGELNGVGVQENGGVMAIYSNGEQRLVGQVALATFEAEGELARAGNNMWAETQGSGAARVGGAAEGSAGSITANALEQSNVDLASEFVDLIAYQRGFQANSRTVTTADQLYQEIVNLKR